MMPSPLSSNSPATGVFRFIILSFLLTAVSCQSLRRSPEKPSYQKVLSYLEEEESLEQGPLVLIFSAVDCPISNRYAPTMNKLIEEMEGKAVRFFMVYPDPEITGLEIKEHLSQYGYSCAGRPDRDFNLVKFTGVTVTPEAALIDSKGKVVYRGRIDNRYVDFGKARPKATTRDLGDAIDALLEGEPILQTTTRAIGCYIPTE